MPNTLPFAPPRRRLLRSTLTCAAAIALPTLWLRSRRRGRRELLTTQIYVQGEPRNARDFLWRSLDGDAERSALTVAFVPDEDGLRAEFPIVVAA